MTQKYVFEAKYNLEALKIGHNTGSGMGCGGAFSANLFFSILVFFDKLLRMIFHKFSIHFHDFGNAIEEHPQRAHALLLRGVLEQLVEGARRTPRDDPALQPGPHLQDTCYKISHSFSIKQVFSRVPSALLNLSLSEKIMKNALSRERFCVYRSRKSRKARENEKVHVSVPKSRGVPKVVCLRGCVPKEQQGVKVMKTCETVVSCRTPT